MQHLITEHPKVKLKVKRNKACKKLIDFIACYQFCHFM